MILRTNDRTPAAREGRLHKARQLQLAADVICMDRLGAYARSAAHDEATAVLAQADKDAAKHLGALLGLKTKAEYSSVPVRPQDIQRAGRAMQALVETAER